jgi:hypothetical protein
MKRARDIQQCAVLPGEVTGLTMSPGMLVIAFKDHPPMFAPETARGHFELQPIMPHEQPDFRSLPLQLPEWE